MIGTQVRKSPSSDEELWVEAIHKLKEAKQPSSDITFDQPFSECLCKYLQVLDLDWLQRVARALEPSKPGTPTATPGLSLTPSGLTHLAWSLAVLKFSQSDIMHSISQAVLAQLEDFQPGEVAMLVWAYAKLRIRNPLLLDAAACTVVKHIHTGLLPQYSPSHLSRLVWAFASLGHTHSRHGEGSAVTSKHVSTQSANQPTSPTESNNFTQTPWQPATTEVLSEGKLLLPTLATHVCCFRDFNQQELINYAWSFAVLDCRAFPFQHFHSHIAELLLKLSPIGLQQLQQFMLWCHLEGACEDLFSPDQRATLLALPNSPKSSSHLHQRVSRSLDLMGVDHCSEYSLQGNSLCVDIALPQLKLAIEVDGVYHDVHLQGETQEQTNRLELSGSRYPMGSDVLKNRQILASGWSVKRILGLEWNRLTSETARQTFLSQILTSIV